MRFKKPIRKPSSFNKSSTNAATSNSCFEVCEKRNYSMITNITFECSDGSEFEDTVRIHYEYWDSEESVFKKSSVAFSQIFTSSKLEFQKFCKDFDIIENDEIHFDYLINSDCMAEYYSSHKKLIRIPTEKEKRIYKPITHKLTEKIQQPSVENIPVLIQNYWFYDGNLYGFITKIREDTRKDAGKGNCYIVYVMSLFNEEKKELRFYTNGELNPKHQILVDLCNEKGISKEEISIDILNETLKGEFVKIHSYKTKTGNTFLDEIAFPKHLTNKTKKQINMFAKYHQNTK